MKKFFKSKKTWAIFSIMTAMFAAIPMTAFADTVDITQITGVMTSGFNQMIVDVMTMIMAIVPIALTLFGIMWAISRGVNLFRTITTKGTG